MTAIKEFELVAPVAECPSLGLAAIWIEGKLHFAEIVDEFHLIYSADVIGDDAESTLEKAMNPMASSGYAEAVPGDWQETEGDEQYDFGYLGNECGRPHYFPAGYTDKEGLDEATDDTPEDQIGKGRHRKWVGHLNREQWEAFASRFCIDLDDDGLPETYTNTMGSLGVVGIGLSPAVAVENTEGWEAPGLDADVIDSTIYVTYLRYLPL